MAAPAQVTPLMVGLVLSTWISRMFPGFAGIVKVKEVALPLPAHPVLRTVDCTKFGMAPQGVG
jgi:hypothetical protein